MCVDSANCNGGCSECLHDTIKRLRARVQELTDALEDYGEHHTGCSQDAISWEPCDCGLRAALTEKPR